MARKPFTSEQIITILRQSEVKIVQGTTCIEDLREHGITEQTYYRWRKEYGGIQTEGAKRLKVLKV